MIYMMLVPKATSYDAVYIAAMYIIFNIDTIYDISGRSESGGSHYNKIEKLK